MGDEGKRYRTKVEGIYLIIWEVLYQQRRGWMVVRRTVSPPTPYANPVSARSHGRKFLLFSRVVAPGLPTAPMPFQAKTVLSGLILSGPVDFGCFGGVPRPVVFIQSFGRQAHRIPTSSLGGDGIWRPTRGCMEPTKRLSLARPQPLCRDFGRGSSLMT